MPLAKWRRALPAEPEWVARIEKKRRHLRDANAVVGGLGCLGTLLGGLFWLMMTAGITTKLGLPALIVCLGIVPACFQLYARTGKHRALLQTVRAAGIALIACILLPPYLCVSRKSEHIPLLYPVKRFVFTVGVRNPEIGKIIMPQKLPRQHDDYYFRTEPEMIAQDYTPFAYLFLHTDGETLRAYEEKLSEAPNLERAVNRRYTQTEQERMLRQEEIPSEAWFAIQNVPGWLYNMMLDLGYDDDLRDAVVFKADNKGLWHDGSGALINYETGLLIVWL